MFVFLNGNYCAAEDARVGLFDGGYMYGDGVYETLRLYAGRPFDLDGHLERLERNLAALAFAWRPDRGEITAIIGELCRRNGLVDDDGRFRLTVSRGGDPNTPLPLADLDHLTPTVSAFLLPIGPGLAAQQARGIDVISMRDGFARGNFPQLKTLNYLPALMALRGARAAGADEALLTDDDGHVLECATSNIFLVNAGALHTPPLRLGLLPGRTRSIVTQRAQAAGLEVRERAFTTDEALRADEVFICGSVKEIVPVLRIDGRSVGEGAPGPVTRRLQNEYRRGVIDSLGG